MKRYTIGRWSDYNDSPAPVFKTRKEAQRLVNEMRFLRAWVEVVELEE